ncbi:MAG TPA: hypothetical protein VGL99_22565, partial [Chloroflexota bacterium]
MARPPDEELDPVIARQSEAAWRRWLDQLGRRPERVAGFGAIIGLAFVLGLAAMYAFIRLADEVLEQQTLALDTAASALILRYQSPAVDVLMRTLSFLGSELVLGLTVILAALFAWQRRWGAGVLVVVVIGGAQLLNDLLKATFQRMRPIPI